MVDITIKIKIKIRIKVILILKIIIIMIIIIRGQMGPLNKFFSINSIIKSKINKSATTIQVDPFDLP